MAEEQYEQKEKFEGQNQYGETVRFTRVWAGHRFTDQECADLLNGKTIVVDGLVSKKGNTYAVKGNLAKQEYEGHEYWGFNRLGFADTPIKVFCGHTFTEDELKRLTNGEQVEVHGLQPKDTSKSPYDAILEYKDVTDASGNTSKRVTISSFINNDNRPTGPVTKSEPKQEEPNFSEPEEQTSTDDDVPW